MFYPALNTFDEKIYAVDSFGGLVTGENTSENSFSEMENLSGALFPRMSVREKRGIFVDENGSDSFSLSSKLSCAVNTAQGILIVTEDSVFLGGKKIENVRLLSDVKSRCAVPVGRNVFIVPDGIYLKISDSGVEAVSCNFNKTVNDASLTFCLSDGTDIYPLYYGEFPESAAMGDELVISSASSMDLYSFSGSEWIKTSELFIRLGLGESVSGFSEGQSIFVETESPLITSGYYTVKSVLSESLILEGSIFHEGENIRVNIKSEIPKMDLAVEHNNRIWGCRFGENNRGEFVNEIYASKLGDPTNWFSFKGISTDSFTANLGCSGEFTGAAALGNEVLFFKEEYIIRVLGLLPSEFQVTAFPARGVEKGAYKTVVSLNERIFYKNSEGIMLYDGNFPVNISQSLSAERYFAHAAGGIDGKYIVSMTDSIGNRGLFCFDTATGLWHREDDRFCTEFVFQRNGSLIFAGENENGCHFFVSSFEHNKNKTELLLSETPFSVSEEKDVSWSAVTGRTGALSSPEKEKIRCLYITLSLGEDSFIEAAVTADENSEKEKIFFLDKATNGIVRIPVSIPPCVKSRLIFHGKGECTVHCIERRVRRSGEVKNID